MNRRYGSQSGFTLIETMIAVGIASLIGVGGTATVYQIFSNNAQNTAHMVAVKQVENALHFLARDVQQAQTIQTTGLTGNDCLKLSWVAWDNSQHTVIYSNSSGKLTRKYDDGSTTTVAQYIASLTPSPKPYVDGTLSVTITCTVNGWRQSTETRTLQVVPRS
jgi:prepilin-type N-terminal cleavage/methylation domain-containing protein